MQIEILPEMPPIRQDESGTLRYGKTRLMIDLVVEAYKRGETPEDIVDSYDTLQLADAYTIIGFYLRHRDRMEQYLDEREVQAAETRKKIEARQGDQSELKARLLARRAALPQE